MKVGKQTPIWGIYLFRLYICSALLSISSFSLGHRSTLGRRTTARWYCPTSVIPLLCASRMRQSQLFTKTRKTAPKDEVAKNAQLLIRAGFIHKEMAGVYSYLPLGLRVFNNIVRVIREEMNAIGGQEIILSALQSPEAWKKTDRWRDDAIDVWFKTALKSGGELGLATTHEEPLTALMTEYIHSYKDLPRYAYQFQTKFRNELRAKSGIMRSREFVMKDLYSFSRSEAEFREFYEECAGAYKKIFDRAGIGERTFRTFASGGSFSKFSDEFQTICDAGEDTIYVHKEVVAEAERLYELLKEHGMEALYDDRDLRAGEKFADADLIGIPTRLVVSEKTLAEGGVVDVSRQTGAATLVPESAIIEHLN